MADEFPNWDDMPPEQQAQIVERNNPDHKPIGPYTGRCGRCGSSDMWDDVTWYGCNCCGAWFPNIQ